MTSIIGLGLAILACTPTAPPSSPAPVGPAMLGRARRPPFACPPGTARFTPPTEICHGRINDWPDLRDCRELEHVVCGRMFGTSAQGQAQALACVRPDGVQHGPFEIIDEDGSIVAEGTCRDGGGVGVLYRWAHGQLSEALSLRADAVDGIDLRFDDGGHALEVMYRDSAPQPPIDATFTCPNDAAPFEVATVPCHGQVADWPGPRSCAAREHEVCGQSFGTSEAGKVMACRRSDGIVHGPIVVRDAPSASEVHATCRDGRISGAVIRRHAGRLTEILSVRDSVLDGLSLQLADRQWVSGTRFVAGRAER